MPMIVALRRLRKEGREFKADLGSSQKNKGLTWN